MMGTHDRSLLTAFVQDAWDVTATPFISTPHVPPLLLMKPCRPMLDAGKPAAGGDSVPVKGTKLFGTLY